MSATSSPSHAPKSMSSRLLTMKFMQRAAASSPTTPSSPDEPSPKRRRTDTNSSPSRINVDALADRTAVQAALASEEAKRQAALEKQAAEAGDTRWILSFDDQKLLMASSPLVLRVVQAGYANIDSSPSEIRITEDDLEDRPVMVGRRSFGRFNKVLEKQQDPSLEKSSESESENDDEDDDDSSEGSTSDSDDPTSNLIKASRQEAAERARAERKSKRHAEKAEAEEIARKRRKNEINLNELTSLSGRQERPIPSDVKCFNCGGNHYKKDCKEKKRSYYGADDGPPRKTRKA